MYKIFNYNLMMTTIETLLIQYNTRFICDTYNTQGKNDV